MPSWRDVLRHRSRLTIGLVLLETITAVQLLIVVTIMPVVVRDLGGLHLYGWAFTASPLAAVISLAATGRSADRWGPARALGLVMVIFVTGTLLAAVAPSMPVFILARFLQGWGLGAQYAVALGAVAKTYPEAHRTRVIALLTAAWVVPSVVGPPVGALLASTVGWRWAFLVSLPFAVAAALLVIPELKDLPKSDDAIASRVGIRWLLQLGLGAGASLLALTELRWWTVPLAIAGVVALVPALRRILPAGSLSARPGLPAAVACSFLLSFAFFGADGFVPLMLTGVRGQSVGAAGVVVTLSAVMWTLGTFWQSRAALHRSRATLALMGTCMLLVGIAGVGLTLLSWVPIVVPYVAWSIAGAGMGIAWPTVPLVAMERAEAGRQTSAIASVQLADAFGAAVGPGLGGAAVALALAGGASLTAGLGGAFAITLLVGLFLLPVSIRLPDAPASNIAG